MRGSLPKRQIVMKGRTKGVKVNPAIFSRRFVTILESPQAEEITASNLKPPPSLGPSSQQCTSVNDAFYC